LMVARAKEGYHVSSVCVIVVVVSMDLLDVRGG
jgi:hypothetical protein